MNKKIEIISTINPTLRFAESENGSVFTDTKESLTKQTYLFHLTADGWMTIQNSQTNNYLTVLSGDEGTFYYTTLQEKDAQK